jgi:hypothetical protein
MLGLQNVGPYMQKKQAQKMEDWSAVPLDNEGKQIQETMTRKFQVLSLCSHLGPNFALIRTPATTSEGNKDHARSLHREIKEDRSCL